jgi:hypothetical protein
MPDKTGLQVESFPRRVLGAVLCVCEREARASLPKGASAARFGALFAWDLERGGSWFVRAVQRAFLW